MKIERRATPYYAHDFWTRERHDFVRSLKDSTGLRRSINWRKVGDSVVGWTVAGIVVGYFVINWLPIVVAAWVKTRF